MNSEPWEWLNRHQSLRISERPVVSTLVGPVGVGTALWSRWCRATGRPCVVLQTPTEEQFADAWLKCFLERCRPWEAVCEYLARRLHCPSADLPAGDWTPRDLELLLGKAELSDRGADRLCRCVLSHHSSLSTDTVAEWFTEGVVDEPRLAAIEAAQQLTELVPAVLVVVDSVAAVAAVAPWLSSWVARLPATTVALAISREDFETYLSYGAESFAKAVLNESVVTISARSLTDIQQAIGRLGQSAQPWQPAIEQLAGVGASGELAERFVAAIAAQVAPATTAGAARSAAEEFLYELFEHTADLAGLFALNVRPGFQFGHRPAEIDLACEELRIAVEIDGYWHFTDPDAYRRDRRKDFELQRQDWLILRFLAEDVVGQMETVCETVRTAVCWRRGQDTLE